MRTLFLAHAASDDTFAERLAQFLELGSNATCYCKEGLLAPSEDLIAKAADGFFADAIVLLLSEPSWPARLPRERWEPVLFTRARAAGVDLLTILLGACPYPPLLERRNFFDATTNPLAAMRLVKRWIWRQEHGPASPAASDLSPDMEHLYLRLADQPGVFESTGAFAARFAREAAQEFEAVFWVPCHRRTLAQITGELGSQLGLKLEGPPEENCRAIQDVLFPRRCLLALDFPAAESVPALITGGRTSTLVTLDPVKQIETPTSQSYARELLSAHRYAEAYDLLYRLLDSGVTPEFCARELTWICEQWDRHDEANTLRFYDGPQPTEQLTLF